MSQLPFAAAVDRYVENEERSDKFINEFGSYITRYGAEVTTLPSFAARFDSIAQAVGAGLLYTTLASANSDLSNIPDMGLVDVIADESHANAHTRYRKESGVLVYKLAFDQLRQDLFGVSGATQIGTNDDFNHVQNSLNARVKFVSLYADLKSISTANAAVTKTVAVANKFAIGDRAGGIFNWVSGNQSANVTADPNEGIWVAPASDTTGTSGAWKRKETSTKETQWFADGSADATAALNAAVANVKAAGGGILEVGHDALATSSVISVKGEFARGMTLDAAGAQINFSHAGVGLNLGDYADHGVGYRLKTWVNQLRLNGPGAATAGSVALKVTDTTSAFVQGAIMTNAETGMKLDGALICDFYSPIITSCGMGISANSTGHFAPNAINYFGAHVQGNLMGVNYDGNPNGVCNWFGAEIEGNNQAGTAADGKSVILLTNAGHHNFIGSHMEGNYGQYGLDYTGADTSKNLLFLGAEVLNGADTGVEMRRGKLTAIASRITASTSTKDINLETGATATLIDTDSRIFGDLSRVLSINYGRLAFGQNAVKAQAPIYVNAGALYNNIAAQFAGNTIITEWDNAAGTRIAYILINNGADSAIVSQQAYGWKIYANNVSILNVGRSGTQSIEPSSDNTTTCGSGALRFSTIYAATGTINTSDARTKQQKRELSDVERAVAVRCKGLLCAFKNNDAVAKKGNKARIHFGVEAQDVMAAFEAEGLNAEDYGLFCYDEWDEIPEHRVTSKVVNAEGEEEDVETVTPAIPAGNRYGIRYEELFAFVISAL